MIQNISSATPLESKPYGSDPYNKKVLLIAQVAIRILLIFAAGLLPLLLFPLVLNVVIVPIVVIGTTFLSMFLYLPHFKEPKAKVESFLGVVKPTALASYEWDYSVQSPIPPDAPPRGIHRGMTMNCWLNTLLQMVRRDERIWNWLRNPTEDRPLLKLVPLGIFVRSYDEAIMKGDPNVSMSTRLVRRALASSGPLNEISHSSERQEDLTAGLETILNHPNCPPECLVKRLEITEYSVPEGLPPISGGSTRVKEVNDHGLIRLSLGSSNEGKHLSQMILNYFKESDLSKSGKVELEGIDGQTHLYPIQERRFEYSQTPEKIWIQIHRFKKKGGRIFKNNSPVSVENEIQIPVQGGYKTYYLDSFAVHRGGSLNKGHYNAHIGPYFCDDDAPVIQPDPEQRQKDLEESYLLLYSHQQ